MTQTETPKSEPGPAPREPFRWQRLTQYKLATLLIFVTACSVLFALFAWWSYPARRQRSAVAEITKVGGGVRYDFQVRGLKAPPRWPAWLVNSLGVDYFANVKEVDLHVTTIRDTGLEHLEGLTALQWLNIGDTQVTNAGLEHLKGLTTLESLDLQGTQVTDAGLTHLKGLASLQHLTLDRTQVTDAGLEHLKGLISLRWICLRSTQLTDAGVAHLRKSMPKCLITWYPPP